MARSPAGKSAVPAASGRKATRPPYYNQTLDFTCGPSSLLMAMKTLDPATDFTRAHEMQLWREANTVFMGKGHPGSSPYGIALAAWRRGFPAEIWLGRKGPVLLDYQPDAERRKVSKLIQGEDEALVRAAGMKIAVRRWTIDDLRAARASGAIPIVLVSTRLFHGDDTPHWVVVAGIDDEKIYVSDPWISRNKGQTARSQTARATAHADFLKMASYGKRRERAVVLVRAGSAV
jgi:predicted double-glycine peptidase